MTGAAEMQSLLYAQGRAEELVANAVYTPCGEQGEKIPYSIFNIVYTKYYRGVWYIENRIFHT